VELNVTRKERTAVISAKRNDMERMNVQILLVMQK